MRRWPVFAFSLIGHIAGVVCLEWLDIAAQPEAQTTSHYRVVMIARREPQKDPILWYDARRTLPDARPDQAFGPAATPAAEKASADMHVLITRAAEADSTRQLIRQPEQPESIPVDVPAPNLIQIPAYRELPVKTFTLPAGSRDPAALPRSGDPVIAVPPAIEAQPGPPAQAAILVGLNPANVRPPAGSRTGEFARAPAAGPVSSGMAQPGAVTPGVAVHASAAIPPVVEGRTAKEIILPGVNRTMSAPLRPSARVIPASVEAQFSNRNVYALVIPGPDVPGYGGDWVMWFSEREDAGANEAPGARISAPIPARKYGGADSAGGSETAGLGTGAATFQFLAVLDRGGHLAPARILRGTISERIRNRAMNELQTWEFHPALKNGEPIAVDLVLEIPFQLSLPAR